MSNVIDKTLLRKRTFVPFKYLKIISYFLSFSDCHIKHTHTYTHRGEFGSKVMLEKIDVRRVCSYLTQ